MSVCRKQIQDERFVTRVLNLAMSEELPTVKDIATTVGARYHTISWILNNILPHDQKMKRKRLVYSRSKTGTQNPMKGKFRALHHNYKGVISDGKGYLMQLPPPWYKGSRRYVFQHVVVMLEALGMSSLPQGFTVHHVDGDKTNNDISNLALLTTEAHARLHQGSHISRELTLWEWNEFLTWKSNKTTPL